MKDMKDLFKKKKLYHKKLAELPFEEKIKIVVKLQKIVNELKPFKKVSGKRSTPPVKKLNLECRIKGKNVVDIGENRK